MQFKYVKETVIENQTNKEQQRELIVNIFKTKKNLRDAKANSEFAEGKLIDYFVYTIKAEQAKLDYLLGKAKTEGISLKLIENSEIEKNLDL